MKALTTAIFGKMSGSDFANDIGGRLYKAQSEDDAAYPYAVYMVVTGMPERTFSERYENVTVQFTLVSAASGSTEIEDMFTHLKALYDECALTISGSTLVWMRLENYTGAMKEEHATLTGSQFVWVIHADFEILTSLN
jgi:hypothetical protein